ncbi:MAG: hypothetical protein H7A51_14815 [Akkermansiaceae bacterium]|nr:hypothetical protein [Akkermansiaceae bacterium]
MKNSRKPFPCASILGSFLLAFTLPASAAQMPDAYDVIWDSPSDNSRGSMPIGNGDIGANVWVEPSGDIVLLLSKTDSFDEFNRLLKLGRVRISLSPKINLDKASFKWRLNLAEGHIYITDGKTKIRVWIDANNPVVQVDVVSETPISVKATTEIWRTEKRKLDRREGGEREETSCAYNRPEKKLVNPDIILPHGKNEITWCHHNLESQWRANLELTALGDQVDKMTDPVLHRTFGVVMRGDGFSAASGTELKTTKPTKRFSLQCFALTNISDSPQSWKNATDAMASKMDSDTTKRFAAHSAWWKSFWNRSHIYITSGADAKVVSEAYILQRYVNACGGRGALPIKFNGTIFTVDQVFDADFRRWGGAYWWQNTRLPYWSMLYSGDYDLMTSMFDMYTAMLPLREAATKKYYNHEGAFFPETLYFWGNYTDDNYGIDRTNKPDGLTDNEYIRRYWQGGIELVGMALDYYDGTQDKAFLEKTLLPLAKSVTLFFDQHWKRGDDGKIFYSPAQSLETWWSAENPTPEIAGMRYLIPRLLELPADAQTKERWKKQLADQPNIPTQVIDGKTYVLPADKFSNCKNSENPELYAVFPYRLYTLAHGDEKVEIGRNTFSVRRNRDNGGWQQQPIQSALLGLGKESQQLVSQRARGKAGGYRFPGFYGPNYDWTPDQDQIGVFQIGLQYMLMQCEGEKIILLPAWPRDWDTSFKLHAPGKTIVEGEVRNGKVVKLKVTPESRRKDVTICPAQ